MGYRIARKIVFIHAKPYVYMSLTHNGAIYKVDRLLLDTGAEVTAFPRNIAEQYGYEIEKDRKPVVLFGFNEHGHIIQLLKARGMCTAEAEKYIDSFGDNRFELVEALKSKYSITDVGTVCDVRRVNSATLYAFKISNVRILTPRDSKPVQPVLGMNVLEKFNFGIDMDSENLLLALKDKSHSLVRPEYRCGRAVTIDETAEPLPGEQSVVYRPDIINTQVASGCNTCWLDNSSVYHTNPKCPSLARSSLEKNYTPPPKGRRKCSKC